MVKSKSKSMKSSNTKSCNGWCWPAIIYVAFVMFSLVATLLRDTTGMDEGSVKRFRVGSFIFHIVMAIFWTWLIYWLCSNCYNTTAWVILFLPFFVGLFFLVVGVVFMTTMFLGHTVESGSAQIIDALPSRDQ